MGEHIKDEGPTQQMQAEMERRAWEIYQGEDDPSLAAIAASPHESMMIAKEMKGAASQHRWVQQQIAAGVWTPAARRMDMARGRAAFEVNLYAAAAAPGGAPRGVTLPIPELARRLVEMITAVAEGQDVWQLTRLCHRLMRGSGTVDRPQVWRCSRCPTYGMAIPLGRDEDDDLMLPRAVSCTCGGTLHLVMMD
jgi:hypothetical protein